MDREEKMVACKKFFDELAKQLVSYDVVKSCNQDLSAYLIPTGTIEALTYYDKPDKSFRISDHWNWYANVNKCEKSNYIQCFNPDLPWAKRRTDPGKASKPIYACQVAFFYNNMYRVVYGEKFDRKTRKWSWVDNTVENVIATLV